MNMSKRVVDIAPPEPEENQPAPHVEEGSSDLPSASESALPRRESILSTFIETSQYQRFVDVCESCQRHHFIGVCYGEAGGGKTLSGTRDPQLDNRTRLACAG